MKTDRDVADSWRTFLLCASGIEGQGYMSQERGNFVWKAVENSGRLRDVPSAPEFSPSFPFAKLPISPFIVSL